jgi:hypothetical protein
VKRDVMAVDIYRRIVECDYQTECIDILCRACPSGPNELGRWPGRQL